MSAASSGGVILCASAITATPRGHFSRNALTSFCNAPRAFASASRFRKRKLSSSTSSDESFEESVCASATYVFASKTFTQSHPNAARADDAAIASGPASRLFSTMSANATPFFAPSLRELEPRVRLGFGFDDGFVSSACLAFASRAASRNNHDVSRHSSGDRPATAPKRASDAQLVEIDSRGGISHRRISPRRARACGRRARGS